MWDAGTHQPVKVFAGHNNSVRALAWMPSSVGSADGELWSAGDDNTVRVWHREKEDEIVVLEQKAPVVCMSAVGAEGPRAGSVWSGGQDGGVTCWTKMYKKRYEASPARLGGTLWTPCCTAGASPPLVTPALGNPLTRAGCDRSALMARR